MKSLRPDALATSPSTFSASAIGARNPRITRIDWGVPSACGDYPQARRKAEISAQKGSKDALATTRYFVPAIPRLMKVPMEKDS